MNQLAYFYATSGLGDGKTRWINIAKGLGIFLVVVGHFHPANSPAYWSALNTLIYTFHMPLFFFISGYLYKYTKKNYANSLKVKFQRLGIPFLTIALIYFLLKLTASYFVKLDYPVTLNSILKLLDNPVQSFVPLLWFVHALLGIFLIYPILRSILRPLIILIISLLAAILVDSSQISVPFFSHAIRNMPYFAFGVVCIDYLNKINQYTLKFNKIFFLFLVVIIILNFTFQNLTHFTLEAMSAKYLQGVMGILAVVSLSMALETRFESAQTRWIELVGICSMSIYLFHTIFESVIRIIFFKYLNIYLIPFSIVALFAIFAGLFVPMFMEVSLLRRSNLLAKLFLGLKLTNKYNFK